MIMRYLDILERLLSYCWAHFRALLAALSALSSVIETAWLVSVLKFVYSNYLTLTKHAFFHKLPF